MVSAVRPRLFPMSLEGSRKHDVRTQFAALPYRMKNGKCEVLLVTSRTARRWIIPKGWPIDGKTASDCAAIEAWEEAGVKGKVSDACIGIYSYQKDLDERPTTPLIVAVFPLKVKSIADDYPEAGQRKRKWFEPKKAAARVVEPELRQLLKHFDPRFLPR